MEPASSSSSSEDEAGAGGVDVGESERRPTCNYEAFDDLPSDDSVGISSDDDDDDDDSSSSGDDGGSSRDDGDGDGGGGDGDDDADDGAALGDRIEARRHGGVGDSTAHHVGSTGTAGRGRRKEGGRRERALAVASERLAAFREEKRRKTGGGSGGGGGSGSRRGEASEGRSKRRRKSAEGDGSDVDYSDGDAPEVGASGASGGGAAAATVNPSGSAEQVEEKKKRKKKSKHRPTEASSRRSDHYRRGAPDLNSSGTGVAIGANRYRPRDPRSEGLSGSLDAEVFERRYAFLEEMKDKEMESLQKRIAARKATGKKGQKARRRLGLTSDGAAAGSLEEDQAELARLKREGADRRRSQVQRDAKRAVKKRIREEVSEGKRGAYYPKRSEQKRMELEARFDELRRRGGNAAVDKALAKRRKKIASKEKRMLPPKGTY